MALSSTLEEGLGAYQIGQKVRRLRLGKSMGLVALSDHTGLSSSLLSKIERDQVVVTLPTLLRIAMVFGVGLEHFFMPQEDVHPFALVRKKDRVALPSQPGSKQAAYQFESLNFPVVDRKLEAYEAEFQEVSAKNLSFHEHEGMEMMLILEGQLEFSIHSVTHVLKKGDAVYFDSGVPHAYRRKGKSTCRAMVVTHV